MPEKFNELLLKPDIIELYNSGITPDYGYLMNGRFEKDMIKTLYPLKTLSGNPITWEASDMEYLFPVVSLAPKQAGSGDPSPENVRPISGWDEVAVTRTGQNLLKFPYYSPGGPAESYNGIDAQIHENGRISIHGTTAKTGYNFFFQFEKNFSIPPGKYYIDAFGAELPEGASVLVHSSALGVLANIAANQKSFTLNERIGVNIYVNSGISGVQFNIDALGVMLCVQSAPTAFIPYTGTTATITLPEPIYGGTVDAVTGVGSKTWGFIASYNGESLPGEWISDRDVYSAGATPTTGAQVAYILATPEPFQATGNQRLTSLVGYNTIYTNGDSITLNRKARRLEV